MFKNFDLLNKIFIGKLLITKYCQKQFLSSLLTSLAIISCVILLIDYMEISKSLDTVSGNNAFTIMVLLLQRSPITILTLAPFAFLFGAQFAFLNLNKSSELIVFRASGLSAWQFISPVVILSFVIGIINITAINPLAAVLKENYDSQVSLLLKNKQSLESKTIYYRQGNDRQQIVIKADSVNKSTNEYSNITFWVYNLSQDNIPIFRERIDAEKAYLKIGYWDLRNAKKIDPGSTEINYGKLSLPTKLDSSTAFKTYKTTQSIPIWRLPSLIQYNSDSGFSTNQLELKLFELLATPFMYAAMAALGAVFSLRLMRLGGISKLIVSGLVLGFIIFFINQLFNAMGKAAIIPTFLASFSPAILAMLISLSIFIYTEES